VMKESWLNLVNVANLRAGLKDPRVGGYSLLASAVQTTTLLLYQFDRKILGVSIALRP
jgi:hypothetical protein